MEHVLDNNREWAAQIEKEQPGFFEEMAKGQSPDILWIGCSDSRVPPGQATSLPPGSIFVHRNIANQVVETDLNCQSVIQYAVQALKVKNIIVCGHYGCGGVIASMNEPSLGQIENWLDHIREVYTINAKEIEGLDSVEEKQSRLCELNVMAQVANVCNSSFVKDAWEAGQELTVHGWIFDLGTGLLKDLGVSATKSA